MYFRLPSLLWFKVSALENYVDDQLTLFKFITRRNVRFKLSFVFQYRTYSITYGDGDGPLPFVLCDSLGLSQKAGLHTDDTAYLLNGHIPDRYQVRFDC